MSGVTTFASVTEQPCACGYLQREADDVASPIVFDATMNEYHFEYPSPCANGTCDAAKARMVIYHCPFCGGLAPPSKRPLLFRSFSSQEQERLNGLFDGMRTLDGVVRTLRPP